MFRRRDRPPFALRAARALWPRGGWHRAFLYIRHRVRRLPDTPEKIARGIWAGVFTTFTPFYGLHFILSLILARLMNGNILAALLATFFGNPLTYVPIGVVSLSTGHFLLGTEPKGEVDRSIVGKFFDAWSDLWANGRAVFTEETANWDGLAIFYNDIFLPYTVGGIAPGIIAGSIAYYLSVPVIRAYQNRRKGRLARKLPGLARRSSGTGGALRHGRDEPRQ